MRIHDTLPEHAPPADAPTSADSMGGLRVGGLVERPQTLAPAALAALPRARLVECFTCEEGWAVEGLAWDGIPLREIIAACQPSPAAAYVRVYADAYWVALPLAELDGMLLCDRLNDAPLSRAHGAPWRLVVPGGACFTSVKWVTALELAAEPGDATAERIARARLASAGSG